jgi:hypothetical protein
LYTNYQLRAKKQPPEKGRLRVSFREIFASAAKRPARPVFHSNAS